MTSFACSKSAFYAAPTTWLRYSPCSTSPISDLNKITLNRLSRKMICSVCRKAHAERYSCCKLCRRNSKRWKQRHWQQNLLCSHRNRDIKAGLFEPDFFCTLNHIKCLREQLNDRCYHCHVKMDAEHRNQPDGMTLQRLDNRLGHTIQNTTLACLSCNRHRVESCDTGWLALRRGQVQFDKLVNGGYQLLKGRSNSFA